MSASTFAEIRCDQCGGLATHGFQGKNIKEARDFAINHCGFKRVKGKDICPYCYQDSEKTKKID